MGLIDSFWGGPRENPTLDEALTWASKHKYGAAIGVGGLAAFAFLRPTQAPAVIIVNPTGPVNTAPDDRNIGKAVGVGVFAALAVGAALTAAERK